MLGLLKDNARRFVDNEMTAGALLDNVSAVFVSGSWKQRALRACAHVVRVGGFSCWSKLLVAVTLQFVIRTLEVFYVC